MFPSACHATQVCVALYIKIFTDYKKKMGRPPIKLAVYNILDLAVFILGFKLYVMWRTWTILMFTLARCM